MATMPKRVKFRKSQRGVIRGVAQRGNHVSFGDFGLQAVDGGWLSAGWLHAKFALVVVLSGVHGFMVRCVRDFGADRNQHSQKFYRIINEVPTILMILIVVLVTVKPFS